MSRYKCNRPAWGTGGPLPSAGGGLATGRSSRGYAVYHRHRALDFPLPSKRRSSDGAYHAAQASTDEGACGDAGLIHLEVIPIGTVPELGSSSSGKKLEHSVSCAHLGVHSVESNGANDFDRSSAQ